jgi:phosphoglycolate phosphatase-like HAD superfamily hydrolase
VVAIDDVRVTADLSVLQQLLPGARVEILDVRPARKEAAHAGHQRPGQEQDFSHQTIEANEECYHREGDQLSDKAGWRITADAHVPERVSNWVHNDLAAYLHDLRIGWREDCLKRSALPYLLLDIDGTLLRSGGATRRAMTRVLKEVFGLDASPRDAPVHGGTDRQVFEAILKAHGCSQREIDEHIVQLLQMYGSYLGYEIENSQGFRVLPGVQQGLEQLRRSGFEMGVLTGNTLCGAALKLRRAGLLGICGPLLGTATDAGDRPTISAIAQERCRFLLGPLTQVVIVGDTPNDVSCAKQIGAEAVAVASGATSEAALRDAGPSLLTEDFGEAATSIVERWR